MTKIYKLRRLGVGIMSNANTYSVWRSPVQFRSMLYMEKKLNYTSLFRIALPKVFGFIELCLKVWYSLWILNRTSSFNIFVVQTFNTSVLLIEYNSFRVAVLQLRKSSFFVFTWIDCLNVDKKIINKLMKWYANTQWMNTAKGSGSNPCNWVYKYQQVMKMTCTITESDLKLGKLMQPKLFSRSLSFASKWAKDSVGSSCHGDLPQKGIIRPCGFLSYRNVKGTRSTSYTMIYIV